MRVCLGRVFVGVSLVLFPPHAEGLRAQAAEPPDSGAWRFQGWGLELGAVRQGLSDELASPLRHRGLGFHAGLARRRSGPRSAWDLELSGEAARAESGLARDGWGGWEDLYRGSLTLDYLRSTGWLLDDRIQTYLGGRVGVTAQFRTHEYWPDHSENFAELVAPLEVAGRWRLLLGPETRVEHTVSVPVVSLILRTPYSGLKYAPDPAVAGPTTVRGFSSRLALTRRLSDGLGLALVHRLSVFHYPEPFPVSWVAHGLALELELLR